MMVSTVVCRQIPEEIEGVGGQEALRVKKFIESRCGKIGER